MAALRTRHLWRRAPELPFGHRPVMTSFAGLVMAVAPLLGAAMPALAATAPTLGATLVGSDGPTSRHATVACMTKCTATNAPLSLGSGVAAGRAQPVPHLTLAQAQPATPARYQCVPYSQYAAIKPGQAGSVSVRFDGYILTYSAAARFSRELAYPGALTVAEGGHIWVLPRPADADGYPQFDGLCAVRFEGGQAPAVLTEGSTGGQCCQVPTLYAHSTASRDYVVAEDLTKAGAGFAWPGWGLTLTTAADQVTLMRDFVFPDRCFSPVQRDWALGLMEHVAPVRALGGIERGPRRSRRRAEERLGSLYGSRALTWQRQPAHTGPRIGHAIFRTGQRWALVL